MNKGKRRRGVVGLALGATVVTSAVVTGAGPSRVGQAPQLPHPGEGTRQTMRTYGNDDDLRFEEFAQRRNTGTNRATVVVRLLPTDATRVARNAGFAVVGDERQFRWNAVTGRPNTCPISVEGGPVNRDSTVTWSIELSVPLGVPGRRGGQQQCSESFQLSVTERPLRDRSGNVIRDADNNPIFIQRIQEIG